ncbi:MAG: GlxA family transcriptional regulator [Anderseniella sp.]
MIPSQPPPAKVFAFLLIDGFALMSFASSVEPLRAANNIAGREIYKIICVSVDGKAATSSVGSQMPCQAKVGDAIEADTLLVCNGGRPWSFTDKKTFAWIRLLSRKGVRIGGVSGGPYVLARAGIMEGRHMTIHWEHAPALSEEFPDLLLTRSRYIIDRDRLTCAGGIAALDMMHAIIAEEHGKAFATEVSDWFLHRDVALATSPQRASLTQRYGIHRQDIIYALELMESNIATPLERKTIAKRVGLSTRQLDRLFGSLLGASFADHYRLLRLERARNLLMQSALPITEVALACGFANASHFSRAYSAAFKIPPRRDRVETSRLIATPVDRMITNRIRRSRGA